MANIAFVSHLDANIYLFRLSWIKALAGKGFEISVVVPEGEYSDKLMEEGFKVINYNIRRGSINPLNALKNIFELYKIFRREKFDAVHLFTIQPVVYGSLAARLAEVPIIFSLIEGLGSLFTVKNLKNASLAFIVKLLLKIAFKLSTKVNFISRDDYEALKPLVNPAKVFLISSTGVDIDYFSLNKLDKEKLEALKQELKIKDNHIVITTIARLIWEKGIKEFVEAANLIGKKYDNIIFLIVGWIDRGNPSVVDENFIKESEKNPNVRFLGARDDIREILALTNIYVLPSYREGIPRTILEAMAMEKPVVTTNAPGCRLTVEDCVNGFWVPVKDSRALAEAIERLIIDKELRVKMGKAGKEKVVKEFSNEVVIRQILELYTEVTQLFCNGISEI